MGTPSTARVSFLLDPDCANICITCRAPIAVDLLFRRKNWWVFGQWSAIAFVSVLLPMARIDSLYYGQLVVAPLNIVMYNVFTLHGPDLYGTEPWYFYLFNGFLNFNIMFLGAIFTPIALVSDLLVNHICISVRFQSPQLLLY